MAKKKFLTTANGVPGPTSIKNPSPAGERGPIVFEDFHLFEKLAHFNRERIPERVVHAKGSGAFGELKVTHDITKYTKAKLFSAVGKYHAAVLALLDGGGEAGSADTERDPRGFSIKFYTEEGNWDLSATTRRCSSSAILPNFPTSSTRKSATRGPTPRTRHNGVGFWSLHPEALHQITIFVLGPRHSRRLPPHGRVRQSHLQHAQRPNERFFVKYHFKTKQGIRNLPPKKAQVLAGTDRSTRSAICFERSSAANFQNGR